MPRRRRLGHTEVHGEFSQERRPRDFVQLLLEDLVLAVGIDPEIDGEVAFGFGEPGHVRDDATCSAAYGLPDLGGLLHGLTRLIEESPKSLSERWRSWTRDS